ncbi:putative dimethylaniline monooxygenase [Microdochium trichocladiopsis]|uniref:Dimethylaniline monooxygenase n=1 Tax=Microdochium trichocladiopsis TaxID=1682393 RepID=A0A9P9BNV4_9PEZI|nr:putative dimethylaniline monooxygenase [Microdochium trichocladiopsis]KAH7028121.1 putative dimethylaniline monooxygenase [Microdochium trichocladiopsis]
MATRVDEQFDLVVIGAGLYGLASAKTHLALHPEQSRLVIESEATCGGTWSRDRLYPGLKTNNVWSSYEYPDFRMDRAKYGLERGKHIPAEVMHRYFTDYAEHFGVLQHIRFNTRVESAEAVPDNNNGGGGGGGGWIITTSSPSTASTTSRIHAKRLIVATGLTSQPNMPTFPGAESFTPPLFHARDFCNRRDILATARHAVVVGGAKSAIDAAYAFATSDVCTGGVDLLIRPSGRGPVWMSNVYATPLKRKVESLVLTRALSWFSPCPWGDEDGYSWVRRFLQATFLGNWLVRLLFFVIGSDVQQSSGLGRHPETKKLMPWNGALWVGSELGIWNYDEDCLALVREGKIRVHLAEVARLEGNKVVLDNGVQIETDVVVCATGWKKTSLPFRFVGFEPGLAQKGEEREALIKKADQQLLARFPILRDQPKLRPEQIARREKDAKHEAATRGEDAANEPLRNYRFIVPSQGVAARNIAFAGLISPFSTAISSHLQGLWITAFFDGKLRRAPPTDEKAVVDEIMLHTQFGKWRHPCSYGRQVPDMSFDSVPYADMLMNDLGLKVRRKSSVFQEWFRAYKPWDYAGVVDEYRALHE